MDNKISFLQKSFTVKLQDIAGALGRSLIKHRNTLFVLIAINIIAFSIKMRKHLPRIIEKAKNIEKAEICNSLNCRPKDLMRLSEREYKKLSFIDRTYGHNSLRHSLVKDSSGKAFLKINYEKETIKYFSKAMSLCSRKINPNKDKLYKDLFYFTPDVLGFDEAKSNGYCVPQFKDSVVIDKDGFDIAMQEAAKNKYGDNSELHILSLEKLNVIQENIRIDLNGNSDAIEPDYTLIGEALNYRYVACPKGGLSSYMPTEIDKPKLKDKNEDLEKIDPDEDLETIDLNE